MNVRRATNRDFDGINYVLEQLMHGDSKRRVAIWPLLLDDRSYTAWVADDAGKIVGFVDMLVWHDIAHGGKVGLVNNLVVDEHVRGQGIARSLLREAIQYCSDHDAIELHVWTDADNIEALRLYTRMGFTDRGRLLELTISPSLQQEEEL